MNINITNNKSNNDVTCVISTKDRYNTTLPLTLISICNQTYKPKYLLIFDDGEHKDLREDPIYKHIFSLLSLNGIDNYVSFGERKGQVLNHIKSVEMAKTEWIWRLDDDNVPKYDTLEKLVKHIGPEVGAIGGLIVDTTNLYQSTIESNKIEDIFLGNNEQWTFKEPIVKEVDHLYSSFLYRKSIAKYPNNLSPIGHREETILTYEMKLKGYINILDTSIITYHFCNPNGGIRSHNNQEYINNDNYVFSEKLKGWNVIPNDYKFIVLDNGIGDHFAFKTVIDSFLEKYKKFKIIMFVCYPSVFEEYKDKVVLSSIAEAIRIVGNLDQFNVYKWMWDHNWKQSIVIAYQIMYEFNHISKQKQLINSSNNSLVISPFSRAENTAKNYPFLIDLIQRIKDNTTLNIIQLGTKNEFKLRNSDIFYTDLSFNEIEELIKNCKVWLSIDNFLQHFINSLNFKKPGIVLWGKSDPEIFGYSQNINILKSKHYLRNDQFNIWHSEPINNDVWYDADTVYNKIYKYL